MVLFQTNEVFFLYNDSHFNLIFTSSNLLWNSIYRIYFNEPLVKQWNLIQYSLSSILNLQVLCNHSWVFLIIFALSNLLSLCVFLDEEGIRI